MSVKAWQQFRYLDRGRYARAFFFADVANLVISAWDLALRFAPAPGAGSALDDLRELSSAAHVELRELLDEADERARQAAKH